LESNCLLTSFNSSSNSGVISPGINTMIQKVLSYPRHTSFADFLFISGTALNNQGLSSSPPPMFSGTNYSEKTFKKSKIVL
jgi:hypothetical protein